MQITTLPVYSKLADEADLRKEKALWDQLEQIEQRTGKPFFLHQHQLETYSASMSDKFDIIMNMAMTGDGKSLAGQLSLLVHWNESPTIALYPTNELIQDQHRSIETHFPTWHRQPDRATMLYGKRLDELEATTILSRPDALMRELHNHKLVLSNPDILHAILQFHYQQFGRTATYIARQIAANFAQFTFDEFHIFDAAQITAVLTGMLFLYEQSSYPLKTLFLSATPDKKLEDLLQRVGFKNRVHVINPQERGWYIHGANPDKGWRQILRGSTINFAQQTAEEWIAENLETVLLPWFRNHRPGAKAALIVNSAATALRLERFLRPRFEAEGLHVEPNTRLNGSATRKASYKADLLIGTSTVDVGVDFQINLLIFEASNAGTFLQRLGRLGRHGGYTRDGAFHPFQEFAAYALVPPFIYDRLIQSQDDQPPRLHNGDTINRQELADHINVVYPPPADFRHYARVWGRFQPAKVYEALLGKSATSKYIDKNIKNSFAPVRKKLQQRYYELTKANVGTAVGDADQYQREGNGALIAEAQSFRGGSPFDCGVLKAGEEPFTYDLFWLLANTRLELLDQKAFCADVEMLEYTIKPFMRGFQVAYFRWFALRDSTEQVLIVLPESVSDWTSERHGIAQILPGIEVAVDGHEWLNTLNEALSHRPIVGIVVPGYDPQQLRREVYLPGLFPLQRYRDANGITGCIAFGRQALLLDSVVRFRKLRHSNNSPFIL